MASAAHRLAPTFASARKAEHEYARHLRGVARAVAHLLRGVDLADPVEVAEIEQELRSYGSTIWGWARRAAARMLADVSKRNSYMWRLYTREMSQALQREVAQAPTGQAMRSLMAAQVDLITSIPREAAERVHREAIVAQTTTAARAKELASRIAGTTASRAMLIARTEVARAASTLTQARAEYVGSDSYVWRTARDGNVRPSHKKMEGRVVKWSDPPVLDNLVGHAGALPNCRCYCEPILPDVIM